MWRRLCNTNSFWSYQLYMVAFSQSEFSQRKQCYCNAGGHNQLYHTGCLGYLYGECYRNCNCGR